MSWGIEVTGTKDAVKAKVSEQLDKCAEGYKGKPEADDIVAVKARALALVDAIKFDQDSNAVTVKANGSHGGYGDGSIYSGSFSLNVTRVALAL